MPHIVTSKCENCKFTDCVLVCPVDAYYELDLRVVIDPEECIDCAACVAECPVEAIYADDEIPEEYESDIEFNATEALRLKEDGQEPLTEQRDPLPTAEDKKAELGY